jgi:hypothetical protein
VRRSTRSARPSPSTPAIRTSGGSRASRRGAAHFLDIDAYGPPPFGALPRDLGAAIEKFGPETVTRNGVLPWRAAEMRGRLVRAFEAHGNGQRYGLSNAIYLTAVLAHYVADAHQPFHAVLNYDGQLTNQHGIHARFEDELPTRFVSRLTYAPAAPRPILETRDAVFDALVSGAALAEGLLAADLRAAEGRTEYDNGYYDSFFAAARPVLERRTSEAITAVAGVILGAWEQAGKPDLTKPIPQPAEDSRSQRPLGLPRPHGHLPRSRRAAPLRLVLRGRRSPPAHP